MVKFLLDLGQVDRETALRTWLVYHKFDVKTLAVQFGVHRGAISRVITGERPSRSLIELLIKHGVPAALLPELGPGPGRPPRF